VIVLADAAVGCLGAAPVVGVVLLDLVAHDAGGWGGGPRKLSIF
jgi:hypothetical protein